MGIFSGDSFGFGGGSLFGLSSSGGRFDFDFLMYYYYYYRDFFYFNFFVGFFCGNNQRELLGGSGCEGGCGKLCFIFVFFFICIGIF